MKTSIPKRAWLVAIGAVLVVLGLDQAAQTQGGPTEAPTGFRVEDNGFAEEFCANQAELAEETPDSPRIPEGECNFQTAVEAFTGPKDTAAGLGPIYNGNACAECHIANPILGATSQIAERRAGFFNSLIFTDHPGGSLIQDRSFRPHEVERVDLAQTNVIALRSTISVLGDGFVEALANTTLQNIANNQPAAQRGLIINVPVLEQPGATRIGRFGHGPARQSAVLLGRRLRQQHGRYQPPPARREHVQRPAGGRASRRPSGRGRRRRGRRAVRAVHARNAGAAGRPGLAGDEGRPGRQ